MRAIFADLPKQLKIHRACRAAHVFARKSRVRISRISSAGRSYDGFILRTIVWFGAQQRYAAISTKVSVSLKKNSPLSQAGFPAIFDRLDSSISVANTTSWSRPGSAANSAVCYCLGITPVDPVENHLVFERFLTRAAKAGGYHLDLPAAIVAKQ